MNWNYIEIIHQIGNTNSDINREVLKKEQRFYPSYQKTFESEEASISFTKKHLTNPPIIIMLDNYKSKQINQTSKSCKQSNPIKHNGYEEEEYII